MKVVKSIPALKRIISAFRKKGTKIGFVPTMGALHAGHLSLIKKARKENDIVVVSIFVNPIQFGPREDFRRYPRPFAQDKGRLEREKIDILFYPTAAQMYGNNFSTYVEETSLSRNLCGRARPGHFRGVATVVVKLFNLVEPNIAYFGQKDYQQARIIERVVCDLNLKVKIKVLPIVREKDGLALSSRNLYLNAKERENALCLFKALQLAKGLIQKGEKNACVLKRKLKVFIRKYPLARIDYVEIVDAKTLEGVSYLRGKVLLALAVFINKVRLIDNMVIDTEKMKFS